MKLKIKIKIITDIIIFLSGIASAVTGLVLLFLPSGPGTRAGLSTASIFDLTSRGSLRLLHDWSSILLIAMVVIHLMLNWKTIICYIKLTFRNNKKDSCETVSSN